MEDDLTGLNRFVLIICLPVLCIYESSGKFRSRENRKTCLIFTKPPARLTRFHPRCIQNKGHLLKSFIHIISGSRHFQSPIEDAFARSCTRSIVKANAACIAGIAAAAAAEREAAAAAAAAAARGGRGSRVSATASAGAAGGSRPASRASGGGGGAPSIAAVSVAASSAAAAAALTAGGEEGAALLLQCEAILGMVEGGASPEMLEKVLK